MGLPHRKVLPPMTVADAIRDHQARCRQHLLRLHLLARDQAGATARQVAVEVEQAASAVLDEVAVSLTPAAVADGRDPGAGSLLAARLARLRAAADEVVAAARDGDAAGLRRQVRRFDALTSAMWTVQHAISDPASVHCA